MSHPPTHPGWAIDETKRNNEKTQKTRRSFTEEGGAAMLSLVTKAQSLANYYLVWFSPVFIETTAKMPASWYTYYALGRTIHSFMPCFPKKGQLLACFYFIFLALLEDNRCPLTFLASFSFLVQLTPPVTLIPHYERRRGRRTREVIIYLLSMHSVSSVLCVLPAHKGNRIWATDKQTSVPQCHTCAHIHTRS